MNEERERGREFGEWMQIKCKHRLGLRGCRLSTDISHPSIRTITMREPIHREKREHSARMIKNMGEKSALGGSGMAGRGRDLLPNHPILTQKCEKCNLELVQSSLSNRIVGLKSQVKGYLVDSARISWLIQILECAPLGCELSL